MGRQKLRVRKLVGSNPRMFHLTNQDFFVTLTFPETLDSIPLVSGLKMLKSLQQCKPRNSKMVVLQCLPLPDSWPKNSLTDKASLRTLACKFIILSKLEKTHNGWIENKENHPV